MRLGTVLGLGILLGVLGPSAPAWAQSSGAFDFRPHAGLASPHGLGMGAATPSALWTGNSYRYPNHGFWGGWVDRTATDILAIPAYAPHYSVTDWTVIAAVVGSTVALSYPIPGGSLDVRAQRQIESWLGPKHFRFWSHSRDVFIYMALGAATLGLLTYGLVAHKGQFVESSALVLESVAVSEIYHLAIKFSTGRQCVNDPGGLGLYDGMLKSPQHFPCGTPSGHMGSMMALVSTLMNYFHNPYLDVALGAVALFFAVTLIADDYHYVSEVLIGAAIGWGIGRWVVDQRSSLYVTQPGYRVQQVRDALTAPANTATAASSSLTSGTGALPLGFAYTFTF